MKKKKEKIVEVELSLDRRVSAVVVTTNGHREYLCDRIVPSGQDRSTYLARCKAAREQAERKRRRDAVAAAAIAVAAAIGFVFMFVIALGGDR